MPFIAFLCMCSSYDFYKRTLQLQHWTKAPLLIDKRLCLTTGKQQANS